ncbi:MAG: hypothetical protein ACR2HA_00295 [Nocardioides sp.]
MAPVDEDSSWRMILSGLGALVVVSLLVGGVVGVLALGAARLSGVGESTVSTTAAPSLYIPSGRPTTRPESFPDPPGGKETSPASPTPTPEATPTKAAKPITLQIVPVRASSGQRVDLSGVYPTGEGATLQVQRLESGWVDFPVTAQVSGGVYRTYIYTERVGRSRFRMVDTASGQASNIAVLTIG